MGNEVVLVFTVGDSWQRLTSGHANYINNGNVDVYLQQNSVGFPLNDVVGVRIRPGGKFFVPPDMGQFTYLRTLSGASNVAKYEDVNDGAGTAVIVDGESGNSLVVNDDGSINSLLSEGSNVSIVDADSGNSVVINELGQMHTVMRALTDTGNSSEVPLIADEVFIGDARETLDYAEIAVAVYADADSALNGLCIDFSSDGVNWIPYPTCMSIFANNSKTFSFQPERKYYRIRYTNGTSPQTIFNLESTLRKTRAKPSSHNINKPIVDDDDAELVKAVITGVRDDGDFDNATLSNSNRLKVVSQPYTFAVAEGDIPNHSPVKRFGHNNNVGTSLETISSISSLEVRLTTAEILKVSSSSANDTSAGTGARAVYLQGLDADYNLQSEIVITNGTTSVSTTKSYLRVLAFYDYDVGSGGVNAGNISIKNNAETNTLAIILTGEGRSNFATFTVPAGYSFYFTRWYGSENSSKGTEITLWAREFDDGGWRLLRLYTLLDNVFENQLDMPLVFPEKTDIEIRAKATLSGANVAGGFYGWMEN